MRASIREVARRAGVSVGTVSNVLNRPEQVAEATRVRVLAAIDELGFVRNEAARALRKGSGRTLGVLVEDLANPYFTDVARGAEAALNAGGFDVLWCTSDGSPEKERRCLDFLEEQGVSGLIVTPVGLDARRVARLRAHGIPVVFVDRRIAGVNACSVTVDHVAGGRLAAEHLTALGRHDLAFVTAEPETPPLRQRRAGALRALTQAGRTAPLTIAEPALSPAAGRRAAQRLLDFGTLPDGILCANDLIAIGVVNELVRAGVKVPQDVAVVGYDDIELAASAVVPLTTVRQPRRDLGRIATELALADAEGRHIVLAPELVVRESAS
ncbi:LacI family transcriptional regulator [Actinocorallia sp. API 0066]|uniref:LacI family DNA-binding transcriptional regulator n=1 Tax=Actinocorallia sp. API 0066 TaxID=2896846 RepID=UPI001E62ED81|nr:LacI family DNA-binding transcriptional regulator [Actinocorallia sp. API 0066]MCD0452275.1 LacI family transcriptional regulator [Actinocorallia sp. API 0066]